MLELNLNGLTADQLAELFVLLVSFFKMKEARIVMEAGYVNCGEDEFISIIDELNKSRNS